MIWLILAYFVIGYFWFWKVLRVVAIGDRPGEIALDSLTALVLWPVLAGAQAVNEAIDSLVGWLWAIELNRAFNEALVLIERTHA